MTTIRPELLAAKLESARNGEPESASFAAQLAETSRLPEVLWMLQEMSRAPGGLLRFVNNLVEALEQWLGRMAPAVVLPESLPSEDVLAVARNHFPGVPEPFLKLIAARAMQSEGYLKNMELCVKRALFLAAEQGRRAPDLRDVEGAIAYIAPSAMPKEPEGITNATPPRRLAAGPMRSSRSESASTLESTFEPDFSRSKPRVNSVELEPAPSG